MQGSVCASRLDGLACAEARRTERCIRPRAAVHLARWPLVAYAADRHWEALRDEGPSVERRARAARHRARLARALRPRGLPAGRAIAGLGPRMVARIRRRRGARDARAGLRGAGGAPGRARAAVLAAGAEAPGRADPAPRGLDERRASRARDLLRVPGPARRGRCGAERGACARGRAPRGPRRALRAAPDRARCTRRPCARRLGRGAARARLRGGAARALELGVREAARHLGGLPRGPLQEPATPAAALAQGARCLGGRRAGRALRRE